MTLERAAGTPVRTARLCPAFLRWPSTRSVGYLSFSACSRARVSSVERVVDEDHLVGAAGQRLGDLLRQRLDIVGLVADGRHNAEFGAAFDAVRHCAVRSVLVRP